MFFEGRNRRFKADNSSFLPGKDGAKRGGGGGAGGDTIENNRILLYLNTIKQKKLNKPNYPKQYAKPSTTNVTSISKIRNSSEPIV